MTYLIEIGNDIGFNSKFATWSTPEQPNQTVLDLPKDVAYSSVYYWHVRASDPTTVGPWSRTLAFATQDPPQPPEHQRTGRDRPARCDRDRRSPRDVANWPITARISVLDFSSGGVDVEFTKKDGPGRWPDVTPPGWDGGIEYTLWMVVNIDGQWYTAGGVEFWNGLGRSGGSPSRFAVELVLQPAGLGSARGASTGGRRTGRLLRHGWRRAGQGRDHPCASVPTSSSCRSRATAAATSRSLDSGFDKRGSGRGFFFAPRPGSTLYLAS